MQGQLPSPGDHVSVVIEALFHGDQASRNGRLSAAPAAGGAHRFFQQYLLLQNFYAPPFRVRRRQVGYENTLRLLAQLLDQGSVDEVSPAAASAGIAMRATAFGRCAIRMGRWRRSGGRGFLPRRFRRRCS